MRESVEAEPTHAVCLLEFERDRIVPGYGRQPNEESGVEYADLRDRRTEDCATKLDPVERGRHVKRRQLGQANKRLLRSSIDDTRRGKVHSAVDYPVSDGAHIDCILGDERGKQRVEIGRLSGGRESRLRLGHATGRLRAVNSGRRVSPD